MLCVHDLVILKNARAQRIGISFVAIEDDEASYGALVQRINPSGAAAAAGLLIDDRVVEIGGLPVENALGGAAALRDSVGEIVVTIERWEEQQKEEEAKNPLEKVANWWEEVTTPRGGRGGNWLGAVGDNLRRMLA